MMSLDVSHHVLGLETAVILVMIGQFYALAYFYLHSLLTCLEVRLLRLQ